MQQGRGGMGMHKHGISGHPTRSPRYKFLQTWWDNVERSKRRKRKPLPFSSVAAAFASLLKRNK